MASRSNHLLVTEHNNPNRRIIMSDDSITISTLYLKRIKHRTKQLSEIADQMMVASFSFKQICEELKEDYKKLSGWE